MNIRVENGSGEPSVESSSERISQAQSFCFASAHFVHPSYKRHSGDKK
jgi:hypothetical protein